MLRKLFTLLRLLLGATLGYISIQLAWVFSQLMQSSPRYSASFGRSHLPKHVRFRETRQVGNYTIDHLVADGIERISYLPEEPNYKTPLVLQHGMFHAAWCWQPWQALFAQWGWQSHAISLPGHGKSPEQRPLRQSTLDYYLGFLVNEIERHERLPVLMGHSMGGALTQWYLKYIGQLPAAVLVAAWVADSVLLDGFVKFIQQDPAIVPLMMLSWDASSWIRSPRRAAEKFLGPKAKITPQELHARLGPESALVTFQHNPPLWVPPQNIPTPSLWLAGELDAVVTVSGLRRSAKLFGGDFSIVPGAGHNLMMDRNLRSTAQTIHDWLTSQGIR
jgi:pimeloyl-ACP methyl ester carboxylesterase